jgi:hypothetical protein
MAWRVLLQTLLRQTLSYDQARPGLMRAMGHPRLCVTDYRMLSYGDDTKPTRRLSHL